MNKISAHQGAMPVEYKRTFIYMLLAKNPGYKYTELPVLTEGLLDAQCDESGILHVTEQVDEPFFNHLNLEDKSYQLLDFSLFYGNLKKNAIARTNAYFYKLPSDAAESP